MQIFRSSRIGVRRHGLQERPHQHIILFPLHRRHRSRHLHWHVPAQLLLLHLRFPVLDQIPKFKLFLMQIVFGNVHHSVGRQLQRHHLFPLLLCRPHPIRHLAQPQGQLGLIKGLRCHLLPLTLIPLQGLRHQGHRFPMQPHKERLHKLRLLALHIVPKVDWLVVVRIVGKVPKHHPTHVIGEGGSRPSAPGHRTPIHPVDQGRIRPVPVGIHRGIRRHRPTPDHRAGRSIARGTTVLGAHGLLRQPIQVIRAVRPYR